jgi:hypothetical protein
MRVSQRERRVSLAWWGVGLAAFAVLSLIGCGGGGGGASLLTLSGDAYITPDTRQIGGQVPLANATVKAYLWPDLSQSIAEGTTGNNGHYVLTLPESAAGKDVVVIATKTISGKLVRVSTVSPDVPREGRSGVNLDVATTLALEEIFRIRQQEGLNDLSPGGVSTVIQRIREEIQGRAINLTQLLPEQPGAGLRDPTLQETVQNVIQQHKGALKGSTGDADVDRARSMMQTMRDMMGTVVGNGRMEGTAIDTALNLTERALDAQLATAEAFGERFSIMMKMLDRLYDHEPGEYRLVRNAWGDDELEYVRASANNRTWKVTSQVEGASNGLVLTVVVDNPVMETFHFDPAAGTFRITATKSGVNYSATLTPNINEANKTAQLTASINLQDVALNQPITFDGTLQMTLASLQSDSGPRATSAVFNGRLSSQFGSAQVNNLKAEFEPDSSQEDSLKRIRLDSLQAQVNARPLSLSLQGVDVPFMKLQGGGTAPTTLSVNTLQITGRDENNKQISLTISQVNGTFEEYRDPVGGMGSGVIKRLSGKVNFASDRLSLSGEISGTWDNPVPFERVSESGHRLSTYPRGTVRIKGNMTPAIGKPAAVDITITSSPTGSPPKATVNATFTYGAESLQANLEMRLAENQRDGVYPASTTFEMTHSPSGMRVRIVGEWEQSPIGSIKTADGTKIADLGEARALGIPDLGDAGIVKYRDGTFETLQSLLP